MITMLLRLIYFNNMKIFGIIEGSVEDELDQSQNTELIHVTDVL